ncbi:TDT family transporter [Methanosphaera sp.]|uniref:TDT family transporter n=1 Tax=Methanosphaera sp. TaxID=2666342 RepID=UPI0025F6E553|nr:TDT family transporter [Methanosphaera sp.]
MKTDIEHLPISIGGPILGIAAMGNLLYDFFPHSREVCGFISALLFILVIIKLYKYPKYFKEDLDNPVLASIIATLSMALMLISNFIYPYMGYSTAISLWIFAVLIHICFVINYIIKFVLHFDITDYTAGSFVVFAGVQMIAITAPTFHQEFIGTIAFWFSFICVILVFLAISYRYLTISVPEPTKPVIGVYAAPFSLCAVGYLASVSPNNFYLVISFYVITKILYIMVLCKFIQYWKLPFYPTYAAYTFPIVINAVTTLFTMKYLSKIGIVLPYMQYELIIEIIIAILLVSYVLAHFIINTFEVPRIRD